ncbi:FMN-binding glutamate synthase family protein [Marivirga arenosa]|uniref:FMN-binding glutamate synthase family protein n=1 Tax=Marivirga arenosa TaxID=3059076 RepID=A0AA52F1J8_9BACT|nr:FMN-binding glutamate synthase family protein [Marivirga sp. BKB1-2]WNB18804.1 FMN-binding glutamate synthase family protein [Marivirga sp. BKB1-2]
MHRVIKFIFAIIAFFIVTYLIIFFPIPSLLVVGSVMLIVGIYDISQKKHTILRNFPIIGHFRYLFEEISPEIHQYFVESDVDGKPLSRNQRSYVYARAKLQNNTHPFGTEHDLQREKMEWTTHSIFPSKRLEDAPRVKIGGANCSKPYEASLFNISAMSYGSLSKNAIMALNKGAKAGGFYHNTGEGSVSNYHLMGGDIVYQVGTAYFGCRDKEGNFSEEKFKETALRDEVKMIELKLSQGAKPGHGGILPAQKNSKEIARIRGVEPHTDVLSPPGHTAFSSYTEMMAFIGKLRELSDGKPIGFKICIGRKNEFESICDAIKETNIYPDFITVDGAEGGTGAAPIIFSDHVGMPWENALVFVVDTLRRYNLRNEIKVITSGKIIDGFDIFKALCLGADICNSARGMMLALGCIQALECHKNTCPTGVATNNASRMRGLVVEDKWKRVKNYHGETIKDFLDLFMASGVSDLSQLNRSLIFQQRDGKEVNFADRYPEALEDSKI